jgi:hypothetical protein
VDESRVIPSQNLHHHVSYITEGMNNRPVGGRSSETQSHSIIINQSINLSRIMSNFGHIDCNFADSISFAVDCERGNLLVGSMESKGNYSLSERLVGFQERICSMWLAVR